MLGSKATCRISPVQGIGGIDQGLENQPGQTTRNLYYSSYNALVVAIQKVQSLLSSSYSSKDPKKSHFPERTNKERKGLTYISQKSFKVIVFRAVDP